MVRAFGSDHAVEERRQRLRVAATELGPFMSAAKVSGGQRAASLLKPSPTIARSNLAVDLHESLSGMVVTHHPFATGHVGVLDRSAHRGVESGVPLGRTRIDI